MSNARASGIRSLFAPVVALLLVGVVQVAAATVYFQQLGEPPVIQFAATQVPPDGVLHEGYSDAPEVYAVTMTIRPAPKDAITIGLKYEGDAVLGRDVEGPTQITLAPKANTHVVELKVLSDNEIEPVERLALVLDASGWVKIGKRNSLLLAIADAPPLQAPKALRFSRSEPVLEDSAEELSVNVELDQPSPVDRTFDVLISGTAASSDHTLGERAQVVVKKGRTEGKAHFSVVADDEIEGDEVVIARLADDEQLRDELRIVDDDGIAVDVRVRFESEQVQEGGKASLIAELVNPARKLKEDLHIQLESIGAARPSNEAGVGDGDFLLKQGTTLTIPTSGAPARLDLPVFADKRYEGDERLGISCSSPQLVAFPEGQVASATIVDGDPRPRLVFEKPSLKLTEKSGAVPIVVRLEGAESVVPISFECRAEESADKHWPSAVESEDFEFPPRRETILPGKRSVSLTLTVLDDELREPNPPLALDASGEEFRIVLSQDEQEQASLPVHLEDDDLWHGDLLLLVLVTQELLSEPGRMKTELEAIISADSQSVVGGSPWLIFSSETEEVGTKVWLPKVTEAGDFELDTNVLLQRPVAPFKTRDSQGAAELRRAVMQAANAADRLRNNLKEGSPMLASVLLDAKAGIGQVRDFDLPELGNKDSNLMIVLQAASPGDRPLNRFIDESRSKQFGQGVVTTGDDKALPLILGALNDFRMNPPAPVPPAEPAGQGQ